MTSCGVASNCARAVSACAENFPARRKEVGCATGKPCARANCLTGLGVSFKFRPAARSGCVSTNGMEKPAACSAASVTAANCGVPAKTTRKEEAEEAIKTLFGQTKQTKK